MNKYSITVLTLSLIAHNNFTKIIDINSKSELNNELKDSNAFIKFSSEACGPCKAIKPAVEKISKDPEFKTIKFIHIDTDVNPDIADEYHVSGIPTFVYKQNNKELYRHTGRTTETDLKRNLRKEFNLTAEVPHEQEPITIETQENQLKQPKQTESTATYLWENIQYGFKRAGDAIKDSYNWLKNKIGSLFGK